MIIVWSWCGGDGDGDNDDDDDNCGGVGGGGDGDGDDDNCGGVGGGGGGDGDDDNCGGVGGGGDGDSSLIVCALDATLTVLEIMMLIKALLKTTQLNRKKKKKRNEHTFSSICVPTAIMRSWDLRISRSTNNSQAVQRDVAFISRTQNGV